MNIERKTYRFRLYPNKSQEKYFQKIINVRRVFWNFLLQDFKLRLDHFKKWKLIDEKDEECKFKPSNIEFLNKNSSYQLWKDLKQIEEIKWLGEVPAYIIQDVIKDFFETKDRFFKKISGFPQKKKFNSVKSFSIRSDVSKVEGNLIKVPGVLHQIKTKYINFNKHRKFRKNSKIKTCFVAQKGNKWYSNILVEWEQKNVPKHKNSNTELGIDRNVSNLIATSNGLIIPTKKFDQLQKLKARRQRVLRRKIKFSQNWKKVIKNIANIDAKIARMRLDYIEKITHKLASENETIYIEDLKIKNMTASASGMMESPGKNVAQKRSLNKSILNQGWNIFETKLIEKSRRYGGKVVKVASHHTSQRCSSCGFIDKTNRKSQSDFECIKCGFKINADINAAKNILDRGKGLW